MSKALTYTAYLKLDELLALQQPRSNPPEHDEPLLHPYSPICGPFGLSYSQ